MAKPWNQQLGKAENSIVSNFCYKTKRLSDSLKPEEWQIAIGFPNSQAMNSPGIGIPIPV